MKTKRRKEISARDAAYAVLLKFEKEKSRLDDLTEQIYSKRSLTKDDRRLLKNLTSGVLRHRLYLDWMVAHFFKGDYKKALMKNKIILRLAFYELLFIEHIPPYATLNEYVDQAKRKTSPGFAKLVNGLLRTFLRQKTKPDPAKEIKDSLERISILYSFPMWMVRRWAGFWGEAEAENLCRAFNERPEFDLVINSDKITPEKFKQNLIEQGIKFRESVNHSQIIHTKDIQSVGEAGLFIGGQCRVQDESARIPVELLNVQEDDLVLDVCAAPGGKYMQILQAGGKAVAVDVELKRLKKVQQNTRRQGIAKGLFVCADARQLPFKKLFSKILVDAPCSGLGVIRKHPDIKWRRELAEVAEFALLQEAILNRVAALLKPGGRLVYSTCTIDVLENENVAGHFLRHHEQSLELSKVSSFSAYQRGDYLRTFPHKDQMDGSFCAVFQKKIE